LHCTELEEKVVVVVVVLVVVVVVAAAVVGVAAEIALAVTVKKASTSIVSVYHSLLDPDQIVSWWVARATSPSRKAAGEKVVM
jgi:hypothetical protein